MCERFSNHSKPKQIKSEFKVLSKNSDLFEPRYNVAPSQMIDVVFEPVGERILSQLKWGLVPNWSKDAAIGNRMINARAETITEKPSFRKEFKTRRCIVPANEMCSHPVSRRVNIPDSNSPELIEPLNSL